ncbi:ABC transporter permease [Treponema pedis]|uniref:ABC transporter permease n=2 Tax=Treponema pedis TaxID=409322 RepID=S6A304_9SPIR|nr:iron ABC transporter permease [Treponema pedis]AGT43111.1 ABC transporter permease [Treponema pedis str. T A4]QOW60678.1 iron ABC transporter permease [Treponema pedis]
MNKAIFINKAKEFFIKPQNVILLVFGIVLTITTVAPIVTILADTVMVHPGTIDAAKSGGKAITYFNWQDLFTGTLAAKNFWKPLTNTLLLAIFSCTGAILTGGIFAYLITRTNIKFKKYLSVVFIFPYIMPQWTLALTWTNLFKSTTVTGGSNGIFAELFGITVPAWFAEGLFPASIVLSVHYAAFAYILISGIFKNMDSNLEEAALILNTPKIKIFRKVTLPLLRPAILSTILLVFGSAMGSYPVPHYLKLTTLSTKYIDLKVVRTGQASIIGVIMMLFGILILIINRRSTKSRKNYTTITGKSGQVSKVNVGKIGKYLIPSILIVFTIFTGIYPVLSFTLETFLPNPGDYSFLKTGNLNHLTLKWWLHHSDKDVGLYGQFGILYNSTFWASFKGTIFVAIFCALIAGTIGLLIGYSVSKNRRSKYANYVNDTAFLPYLLPSLAVGIAFFIFGSMLGIYDTFLLLIIVGTIKYIPFSSRSSLNSMLQISNEIEEAALMQNIPWYKRMTKIIIPIQKTAILSGYLLPFITCVRELTLFMLLCSQSKISTTMLDYYDEMGLYAFSSAINLILIIFILTVNFILNKLTKSGIDTELGR